MQKTVTPTQLRANLLQILDEVLETGEPCEVAHKRGKLLIVPARRDLNALPKRRTYACTADELVATTWEFQSDTDR